MPSSRICRCAFAAVWAGIIFGTSCAVVRTDQLFRLVKFFFGSEILERFEVFWGIAWFTIVKGWHVTEFAILTMVISAALRAWYPNHRLRAIFCAAVIALAFAASDEFHQAYVPDRGGTVTDVLIDSLGVGLVTLIWLRRCHTAV